MSRPRRIVKGCTYFVTRRCIFREFRLRPDKQLDQIVGYCLAYAAAKSGIQIHAFFVASNHLHIILTDPNGCLPKFMQSLDGLIARAVNCLRKRWDRFWEGNTYSAVELLTNEAILEKTVYTITNPVKDFLVPCHYQWPGLISKPSDVGRWFTFKKPKTFFRQKGLPDQVAFQITPPPLATEDDVATYPKRLAEAIAAREAEVHAEAKKLGKRFLGRRIILRQSFLERPHTTAPRRKLNPRLAAQNPGVMAEAKQQLCEFYRAYAEARDCFAQGMRDVLFPEGTYLMQIQYGVCCNGPSG